MHGLNNYMPFTSYYTSCITLLVFFSEAGILKENDRIEDSVDQHCPTSVVNATTSIALRANRVLQVAMRETENSEDPVYVDRVNEAVQRLRASKSSLARLA